MFVPRKNGKVVQFELSALFAKTAILISGILVLVSIAIFIDYIGIKQKTRSLSKLQNQIVLQQFDVQKINNRLITKRQQLDSYEAFDRKLRLISGLPKAGSRIRYIGGSKNGSEETQSKKLNGDRILESLKKLDLNIKLREISFFQLGSYLDERKEKLSRTPSISPTKGHISSRFGIRKDPFTGKGRFHRGLDIANREYTPIYAPADGIVDNTWTDKDFGMFLVIDHGYNIVTRYAHLAKYEVKAGRRVKRGDIIARMGNTGLRSTGPHLHYEVLINDQHVDPEKYIFWDY